MRKRIVRTVQRWHKGACRGCYSLGIAEGGKNIAHNSNVWPLPSSLCFQCGLSWDGSPADLLSSEQSTMLPELSIWGLGGQSRVTVWSRNGIKNVSTETGPGDNAELRWRWPQFRCRPTAGKNSPAVRSLQKTKNKKKITKKNKKNKRLPESAAGTCLRQLGEIPEPGDGGSTGVFVCYYSRWSSACLRLDT